MARKKKTVEECTIPLTDDLILTIKWADPWKGRRWRMTISFRELLYPDYHSTNYLDPVEGTPCIFEEIPIGQVRKILKLFLMYAEPEEIEQIRTFCKDHPIRRYKKYLEILEVKN